MKNIILLISVLIVGACASTPTIKSMAGTYEGKNDDGDTIKGVFLENGVLEGYENGEKDKRELNWKISKEGEIHVTGPDEKTGIWRINKDGSITGIADINKDGKREDYPKEDQDTYKRIK